MSGNSEHGAVPRLDEYARKLGKLGVLSGTPSLCLIGGLMQGSYL